MIVIDVQPYCEECINFDPDVEKHVFYTETSETGKETTIYKPKTTIRCKSRRICEHIKRYLEKRID